MIKKIMIPLDGSELAETALPYAKSLASTLEAELIMLQVLLPWRIMPEYETGYFNEVIKQQHDQAKVYLSNCKGDLKREGLPSEIVVLDGERVPDTIIEYAREEDIDLIVMSTHGRSGLGQWVYGSVANYVLQHAHCPVFLVRPDPDKP